MRKVMIGSPSYDGRIDVWYTNSLVNTVKESYNRGVEIIPMWVSFDALIQRCRNDTIQLALVAEVDDLIFIDTDIEWEPEWIFKLLEYPEDVVGGTYRKKGDDKEEYVLRMNTNSPSIINERGLLSVSGLGTGFVKLSKRALQHLWDVSEPYLDTKDNMERRMICDISIKDGQLYSEDINMFQKLKDGGFDIWLDTNMTCNHIGSKKYKGDFSKWFKQLTRNTKQL